MLEKKVGGAFLAGVLFSAIGFTVSSLNAKPEYELHKIAKENNAPSVDDTPAYNIVIEGEILETRSAPAEKKFLRKATPEKYCMLMGIGDDLLICCCEGEDAVSRVNSSYKTGSRVDDLVSPLSVGLKKTPGICGLRTKDKNGKELYDYVVCAIPDTE